MSLPRPPLLGRVLSRLLIGPDADVVRGDLEEGYRTRVSAEGDSWAARFAYLLDVAKTLFWWWRPGRLRTHVQRPRSEGGEMRATLGELRQIWWGLVRRPAYAAVVILTLGLGIGATTTIYSVVDAMMIRPMPYRDGDRIVVVGNTVPGDDAASEREGLPRLQGVSALNYRDLTARVGALEGSAAVRRADVLSVERDRGAELLPTALVSDGFFDLLSVTPLLGRIPSADSPEPSGDAARQSDNAALISYEGWQTRMGGDPNVLGKQVAGGITIVGVLPPDFHEPVAVVGEGVEFWMQLDLSGPRFQDPRMRARRELQVIGKLAPGATLEQAQSELSTAQATLVREEPAGNTTSEGAPLGVGVLSLRDETLGSSGRPLLLFLGASLLLLILSGLNAANLLFTRGLERAGDLALRRALGAGRARLAGGLIAESVTLALAGGVVGVTLAVLGMRALHRFAPVSLPRLSEVAVNPRVAIECALLSLIVGVGIGLVPALRSGGFDLLAGLRSNPQGAAGGGTRLRSALASTQLALALVLGVGASLLFRSFLEIRGQALGFQPDGLTAFNLPLKAERWWEDWDRLVASFEAVPGVTSAAASSNLPFQTSGFSARIRRVDQSAEGSLGETTLYGVTPGFFATAGIPVLQGRAFDATDGPEGTKVAMVNQALANELFREANPLGALFHMEIGALAQDLEIVGVVGDVVQARVEDGMLPAVYLPHTQWAGIPNFIVSSEGEPAALAPELRAAVARAGFRGFPLLDLSTMNERIDATRVGPRFQMLLIASFALTALLLSAIGLYATLAFTVRSRTREIGIRMAMGAASPVIYRLVMRQGLAVLAVGLLAGTAGALAVTRLLQSYLFHVTPLDPAAFLLSVGVLAGAVLIAALLPASRAARIDPLISIRMDG